MAKHEHETVGTVGTVEVVPVAVTEWQSAIASHEVELPDGSLALLSEISHENVRAIFSRGLDALSNAATNNGVNKRVNEVLNPGKPSAVDTKTRNTWKEAHADQVDAWVDEELAALTETIMTGKIESSGVRASAMDKIRFDAAKAVLQSAFDKNNDRLRAIGKPATFGFLSIRHGKGVAAANEVIVAKNESTVRDFMRHVADDSHKLASYRPEYDAKIAEMIAARNAAKADTPEVVATVDGLE